MSNAKLLAAVLGMYVAAAIRAGEELGNEPGPSPAHEPFLRLSEAAPEARAATSETRHPVGVQLAPGELEGLLRRLPAFATTPAAEVGASGKPEVPAPPVGDAPAVRQLAPPALAQARAESAPSRPLTVVQRSPEGDVDVAIRISMTFSEPMVALGEKDVLAPGESPTRLTPAVDGQWRWVGTKTLIFEPRRQGSVSRLPHATGFRVEVPAGLRAVSGTALEASVSWTFATPGPKVLWMHPKADPFFRWRDSRPLFLVVFDQPIHPGLALGYVHLTAAGVDLPIRQATADEIRNEGALHRRRYFSDHRAHPMAHLEDSLLEYAGEDRWLAFRPLRPMPAAPLTLRVAQGSFAAEGDALATPAESSLPGNPPLEVRSQSFGVGWREEHGSAPSFHLHFTNELAREQPLPELVRVEPEVTGQSVEWNWHSLRIGGGFCPDTSYTVTVRRELRDLFGQTLDAEVVRSFHVAPESLVSPMLRVMSGITAVLNPLDPLKLSVLSAGQDALRARIWRVGPADWEEFHRFLADLDAPELTPELVLESAATLPPGELLADRTVPVLRRGDDPVETRIDLGEALPGGLGQLAVLIEPGAAEARRGDYPVAYTWVQATRIALEAYADRGEVSVWATSLTDGRPLGGIEVSLIPDGPTARTDAGGMAALPLEPGKEHWALVARHGDDLALLTRDGFWNAYDENEVWVQRPAQRRLIWHVLDDRGLYRPGEEVHVKGWVRSRDDGEGGDLDLPRQVTKVAWTASSAGGVVAATGETELTRLGGFDLAFRIPHGLELGQWAIDLKPVGEALPPDPGFHRHSFRVEAFRRIEYRVSISTPPGPHVAGDPAVFAVRALYYAGGVLPGARVRWAVEAEPLRLEVPGWEGFTFGAWTPWWDERGEDFEHLTARSRETFESQTGETGEHRLRVDCGPTPGHLPCRLTAHASVQDVNRQEWGTEESLLVLPAAVQIGLRSATPYARAGEPFELELVATDVRGQAIEGRQVEISLARLEWVDGAKWRRRRESPAGGSMAVSLAGPIRVPLSLPAGGSYRVRARAADDRGRIAESELTVWVAGVGSPPGRDVGERRVTIVPDRAEHAAGDTARLLLIAPFFPAEGLVTTIRSGIVRQQRVSFPGPTATVELPISEGDIPNLAVVVSVVGLAHPLDRNGQDDVSRPKRPAHAFGRLELAISPRSRALQVSASPRLPDLAPGGETTIDLAVRDATGSPVAGAEATVIVVDESVLDLARHELVDPLGTFHVPIPEFASLRVSRWGLCFLPSASELEEWVNFRPPAPDLGLSELESGPPQVRQASTHLPGEGSDGPPLQVRRDFNPLAAFVSAALTDEHGRAEMPVRLPHNITRYRVHVIAAAGARQFGLARAAITARLPLVVRPSLPRFLTRGDRAELAVVVQNSTGAPLETSLGVRGENLEWADQAPGIAGVGRKLTLPPHDRVEVRFAVTAARAGTARLQAGAAAGDHTDAAEIELQVQAPLVPETMAVHGELTGDLARVPVAIPADADPDLGGLRISLASSAVGDLAEAARYLDEYPHGCSEQIASALLARLAAGASPDDDVIARQIGRLVARRDHGGGFRMWDTWSSAHPYISAHVGHALGIAAERGAAVPLTVLLETREYLGRLGKELPADSPEREKATIVSYTLWTSTLLDRLPALRQAPAASGEDESRRELPASALERARELARRAPDLPIEAAAWLLGALGEYPAASVEAARLRSLLAGRAIETAGEAHFVDSYTDGVRLLLHSSMRTDAVVLLALAAVDPEGELASKLARGLLAARIHGRWATTQENAFALLALRRYLERREPLAPDFVARAWWSGELAGEETFRGRSPTPRSLLIPMSRVRDERAPALLLAREGAGRLYFRVALEHAPREAARAGIDRGFEVDRRYEPVLEADDVRRDAGGAWRIRAGAVVRVRVRFATPLERHHVALVDRLPAGLEPVQRGMPDPTVFRRGAARNESSFAALSYGLWFDHQSLRDDRVEAFGERLPPGAYEHNYLARATTLGSFTAPPPTVEEMYSPDVSGRGATDRVLVE